jgi:hypothetical protein
MFLVVNQCRQEEYLFDLQGDASSRDTVAVQEHGAFRGMSRRGFFEHAQGEPRWPATCSNPLYQNTQPVLG